jgi:hypothetical protein
MEFFVFPSKDRGSFWKQVDAELEALEKDVNSMESGQQSQAWTEYANTFF